MKFSLAANAFSSLNIALENFKSFYYDSKISQSQFEEYVKIGIVFLENSIELMLKAILSSENELIIFEEPNCKTIQNAKKFVNEENSLYDVLIHSKADIHTISYSDTIKIYNEKYHNSQKLKVVLDNLGAYRNRFTHFGIEFASYDEIVCIFINSFDVIYNYLYPQLIQLDEIGEYFVSDDIFVSTIHGIKPLFDVNMRYNNIVDLLDEILGDGNRYLFNLCYSNFDKCIQVFEKYYDDAIKDKKLNYILGQYNVELLPDESSDYKGGYAFEFSLTKDLGKVDVLFRYLPYYNANIYCNEVGILLFVILFSKKEMFIYEKETKYPEFDEADTDVQWEEDCKKGLCKKYILSKNNLIKAIETVILREFSIEK